MSLQSRIRDRRKELNLSQEAVARLAGVSLNLINKIERGAITDPHYSTLNSVAGALDMSLSDLLLEEPALSGKAEAPEEAGPSLVERAREATLVDEERRSFGTLIDQYEPIRHQFPLFDELSTHGKQELFERVWSLRERVYSARDDLPSPGAAFLHDALTNAALFFIEAYLRERQQRSDEEASVGTETQLEEAEFERRRAEIRAETRRISA